MVSGKRVGLYVLVALPTLFMLIWTVDAALIPGADVFVIAAIQLIALVVFFGYLERKS